MGRQDWHMEPPLSSMRSTTQQTALHALCTPAAGHALVQLAVLVWLPCAVLCEQRGAVLHA